MSRDLSELRARGLGEKVVEAGGSLVGGSGETVANRFFGATHVIVADERKSRVDTTALVVREAWLRRCFAEKRRVPVEDYLMSRKRTREFWACQREPAAENSVKVPVIDALKELQKFYEGSSDRIDKTFKSRAVGKLVAKYSTGEPLDFTGRLGRDVAQIVETGTCEKLENFRRDSRRQACVRLEKVWGIGPVRAGELYRKYDVETVDDLRELIAQNPNVVESRVQKSIRCYEDLQSRIPRDEAKAIGDRVGSACPKGCSSETVGSYRRGAPDCGDVDVLVTCERRVLFHERARVLETILENLGDFVTDRLAETTRGARSVHADDDDDDDGKPASFMGICKLRDKYRRLDIKVYDRDQFAFALLYFTGSDHFNRSMRHYAKTRKAFSLSDRGLFPLLDGSNKGSTSVVCRTEKEIFRALDLEYRTPHERSCDATCDQISAAGHRLAQEAAKKESQHEKENCFVSSPCHQPAVAVANTNADLSLRTDASSPWLG